MHKWKHFKFAKFVVTNINSCISNSCQNVYIKCEDHIVTLGRFEKFETWFSILLKKIQQFMKIIYMMSIFQKN
jgi:hypothetical protein